jgi:two-component system response regulator AtoC
MKSEQIVIIEDDEAMQFFLSEAMEKQGYRVAPFLDAESALAWLEKEKCDLVLVDIKLPGMDGIEAINAIQERSDAVIILITAFGTKKLALEAIRKGAYDYFTKPFELKEMEITIKRALEKRRLRRQVTLLKRKERVSESFADIVGQCKTIKEVLIQVARVAESDSTVLILGETGTGKELIAKAIHEHSFRKDKPFVTLNCVAIPEGLLESELFGHEKGAFTGAITRTTGKFELADKGTVFLDEIGDMTLSTQAKMLRILETKELERVGGSRSIKVDVRVIAATNKNLTSEVKEKRFREDLFFRLNVVPILVPPLRERKEDIPLLVEHFIEKATKAPARKTYQVASGAMELLMEYSWPGNVRELENAIERAVVMVEEGETLITQSHLPLHLRGLPEDVMFEFPEESASLDQVVSAFEKDLILRALHKTGGVQCQAAQLLGITERSMWHRTKKYAIEIESIKEPQRL